MVSKLLAHPDWIGAALEVQRREGVPQIVQPWWLSLAATSSGAHTRRRTLLSSRYPPALVEVRLMHLPSRGVVRSFTFEARNRSVLGVNSEASELINRKFDEAVTELMIPQQ